MKVISLEGTDVPLQAHSAGKCRLWWAELSIWNLLTNQLSVSDFFAWVSTSCLEPIEEAESQTRCFRQRVCLLGQLPQCWISTGRHLGSYYVWGFAWSILFDDFTLVELSVASDSGEKVAEGILELLGWPYSKTGRGQVQAQRFKIVRLEFSDAMSDIESNFVFIQEMQHLLKGKLFFAESQTFGSWLRWFRGVLAKRALALPGQILVGQKLLFELSMLKSCLACSTLRVASEKPHLVIFTDAAGFEATLFWRGARSEYRRRCPFWCSAGLVFFFEQCIRWRKRKWSQWSLLGCSGPPKLCERKASWFLDSSHWVVSFSTQSSRDRAQWPSYRSVLEKWAL